MTDEGRRVVKGTLWGTALLVLAVGCSGDNKAVPDTIQEADQRSDVQGDLATLDLVGQELTAVDERSEAEVVPSYPLDDTLKLNHIQVKGTHNSYHKMPPELATPEWNYEHAPLTVQLSEYGVRQVELDVHWEPGVGFRVFHIPVLDDRSTCDTFLECLSEVKAWSDANPWHVPLFILVEPKDDIDPPNKKIAGHYQDLDAEVFAVWPRDRLVMPDDLRGEYSTLQEAAKAGNWPTLGFARGKAVFVMLDHTEHAQGYLAEDPLQVGRPFFIMENSEQPWTAFWEVGQPLGSEAKIAGLVEMGYMVRTTADSTKPENLALNPEKAAAGISSGAHVISSDFPAEVADGYWFDLEGGSSRCNPLTAPLECTQADVEIGAVGSNNEVR